MKKMLLGAVIASALLLAGAGQAAVMDLARKEGCLNCHDVNHKLVGPSLKDIAGKYAPIADASVTSYLATKILGGSYTLWGRIPMPPNANLQPSDAKTLADFILTLK